MGTVNLIHRVKAPDAKNPDGGFAPVSPENPLPVDGAVMLRRAGAFAGGYARIPPGATVGLGALGDYLHSLLVIPGTGSLGAVTLSDGTTSFTLWPGGPLTDHRPFRIDIGAYSRNGPWTVTTGNNVSVLAVGGFN
jgi:hypothetical protein